MKSEKHQIDSELDFVEIVNSEQEKTSTDVVWKIFASAAGVINNIKFNWLCCTPEDYAPREAGWKLHVSSNTHDAVRVLKLTVPILFQAKTAFKITETPTFLAHLNYSPTLTIQAGKFITIYPKDDAQAVKLAELIDVATKGITAPRIATDFQFKKGSLVYYRWGAFTDKTIQTLWGGVVSLVSMPDGSITHDIRRRNKENLKQVSNNPFVAQIEEDVCSNNVIFDRYWKCQTIHFGVSTEVFLGIDLVEKKRCIIKVAELNSFLDSNGNSAITRLISEAEILDKLQDTDIVPLIYDQGYDKKGNYCVVMEDIDGCNLYDILLEQINDSLPIIEKRLKDLALSIANIIRKIHSKNLIHADIKPQNIIVNRKGEYKLIDFDSAYTIDKKEKPVITCGTPGFDSINVKKAQVPNVTDDIYSLGAILYYFVTNTNPEAFYLSPQSIMPSIISYNDNISMKLGSTIINCLHHKYNSVDEFICDLYESTSDENELRDLLELRVLNRELVNRFIERIYFNTEPHNGLGEYQGQNKVLDDMRGTAGILSVLAHYHIHYPDNKVKKILSESWKFLSEDNDWGYNRIPGLYVGETGRALALLYCGVALQDKNILSEAQKKQQNINTSPHLSIDLYNGSAGRLRANCIFSAITKNNVFMISAVEIFEFFLSNVIEKECNYYWYNVDYMATVNEAINYNNKEIFLGYAHGVSGIADTILDYYLISGDIRAKAVVKKATDFLISQRIESENQIMWPDVLGGSTAVPSFCRGSVGICTFLMRAQKYLGLSGIDKIIQGALPAIVNSTIGSQPIQCHGIASVFEFLLTTYKYDMKFHDCHTLLSIKKLLETWSYELMMNSFNVRVPSIELKSYMTGIPGLISALAMGASCGKLNSFLTLEYALEIANNNYWLKSQYGLI